MMKMRTLTKACIAAAFTVASTSFAAQLRLDPPCPTPSAPGLLIAISQGAGPVYVEAMSMSLIDAGTLKVVYRAIPGPGGVIPVVAQSSMPALPPGDYALQAYYRLNVNGFLDPEVIGESFDFRVESSAQTGCHPWTVTTQGDAIQEATIETPFAAPLSVVVRDDRNAPVQGAHVHFRRLSAPGNAAATLSDSLVITDTQGRAAVNATANASEGSYVYAAYVTHANVTASAYFTLRNRATATSSGLPPVVEYFNAERSHYFMTSDPHEMQLLDDGTMKGWTRTGVVFSAFMTGTPSVSPVCRLYGKPEAGLDSHFYSASPAECSETLARFPDAWIFETDRAFGAVLPDTTTGECATAVPLYRVFNNRPDANHRYLTTKEGVQVMLDRGWVREGYGPDAVAMCVAA
jgi:hypothetical protein